MESNVNQYKQVFKKAVIQRNKLHELLQDCKQLNKMDELYNSKMLEIQELHIELKETVALLKKIDKSIGCIYNNSSYKSEKKPSLLQRILYFFE